MGKGTTECMSIWAVREQQFNTTHIFRENLLRKFYGRHHDLVDRYGISVSQMTMDMFHLSSTLPGL
jgi:hypothetical protein